MKAVNLIPADQRRGAGGAAGRAGGVVYVIVGGLVVLVLMSVLYAVSSSQVSDRKSKLANVSAQASVAQSEATALQPYVSFASLRQTRQQAISSIAGSRFDWSGAMDQIARSLPNDVTLSAMTGAPPTSTPAPTPAPAPTTSTQTSTTPATTVAPPAAPVVTGPSVALTGCASTHTEVASVLVDLQRIEGVESVSLASSQKGSATAATGGGNACPGATFTATVAYGPQTVQSTDSTTNGVTAATATSPTAGSTR